MLILGIGLAVIAFVLVLFVLRSGSSPSSSSTSLSVPTATATVGTPLPTATPTIGVQEVVAAQKIAAGTRLTNISQVYSLFRVRQLSTNATVPADVVTDIGDWLTSTKVISGTSFFGELVMTQKLNPGDPLLTTDYTAPPFSPPNSISYDMDPGQVAISVSLPPLAADNQQILAGDYVDILLSIRQQDLKSFTNNPPNEPGGPFETQQLIDSAKVLDVLPVPNPAGGPPSYAYTVEMPLQDALILKYIKDTVGTLDLVLISAADVKSQLAQPKTNAVVPEFFLTPLVPVKGTPGTPVPGVVGTPRGKGVPNVFVTAIPTYTPRPTPSNTPQR
jgi:Flp pilus assembly protein CpaB